MNFDGAFKEPEMVKPRLCIVLSKAMKSRPGLCTVVPLSTTPPGQIMPYHVQLVFAFALPERWGNIPRWLKGDMIYTAGFHRIDLLMLGKDTSGKRVYQLSTISRDDLARVQACVLHGIGLSELTKHL